MAFCIFLMSFAYRLYFFPLDLLLKIGNIAKFKSRSRSIGNLTGGNGKNDELVLKLNSEWNSSDCYSKYLNISRALNMSSTFGIGQWLATDYDTPKRVQLKAFKLLLQHQTSPLEKSHDRSQEHNVCCSITIVRIRWFCQRRKHAYIIYIKKWKDLYKFS